MKKLVLALVCLVSVAFFASCEKEAGIPTINFTSGEGYISTDATIEAMTPFMFGIQAKANPTTLEPLTKCTLQVFTNEETKVVDTMFVIDNQPQFNFDAQITLPEGVYSFVATVYNDKDMTNECRMTITSVTFDTPIEASDFEWFRWGNHEQHGLEEFGLYWDRNRNAIILPTDGTTLFTGFTKEQWDAVNTQNEKAAFILEALENPQYAATEYTGISTNGSGPVGDVILTLTADGNSHLIYIDRIQFGEFGTYGYPMTVTGQAK